MNEDKPFTLDPLPIVKKGRTFAGFDSIRVFGGCKIDWDSITKGFMISTRENSIFLQIGNPITTVNGKDIEMDHPPFIKNNQTYLPLRFVCENLGASVEYEAKTRTITIIYPRK